MHFHSKICIWNCRVRTGVHCTITIIIIMLIIIIIITTTNPNTNTTNCIYRYARWLRLTCEDMTVVDVMPLLTPFPVKFTRIRHANNLWEENPRICRNWSLFVWWYHVIGIYGYEYTERSASSQWKSMRVIRKVEWFLTIKYIYTTSFNLILS